MLSRQDMQDLEMHSAIRESQEMQNTMLKLSRTCFDDCVTGFMSAKLNGDEAKCISNCSTKFWAYFNRAQSHAQEFLTARIQEQMNQK